MHNVKKGPHQKADFHLISFREKISQEILPWEIFPLFNLHY